MESGGRLAVTSEALRSTPSLQTWSGITPLRREPDRQTRTTPPTLANARDADCSLLAVQINGIATGETLRVCGQFLELDFASRHVPAWSLSSAQGLRALRITLGGGSLVVTGPRYLLGSRAFLREDDAQAFIDAIQLGRGDRLSVLSAASAERLPAALSVLRSRHLVVLANLREHVVEAIARQPLMSADSALEVAAALEYEQQRSEMLRRLAVGGTLTIDCAPERLAAELVNRYTVLKRTGAI